MTRYAAILFALWFTGLVFGQGPNDNLQESTLNSCNWEFVSSNNGTYKMQNGLVLVSDPSQSYSAATVYAQYYAPGDFDVQVDYAFDSTWNAAIVPNGSGAHFQGAAFTVYFDGQNSLTLFRNKTTGGDQLFLYGVAEGQTVAVGIPFSDPSGTLRITRTGMLIEFMGLTGSSWTTVGSWTGPIRPAIFSLGSANVNALNSVTTTFQNFQINSGNTNFQPYQLPATVLARSNFSGGFVSARTIFPGRSGEQHRGTILFPFSPRTEWV